MEETKQFAKDTRIVYDDTAHLNELLKEIISNNKEDGYDRFEEISMFIKKKMAKLKLEYKPTPFVSKPVLTLTPIEEEIIKTNAQIKVNKTRLLNHYMDDILSQADMLEKAGISFNKTEWYKIRLAMKKLLVENNCEYIRFFGKIFGIESDYYVMQGILKDYPMKCIPKHKETRGNEGINRYTFWVSDSVLEYWQELPDITHEQIKAARLFKYMFTGNLNSEVKSFIPFPGKEMHLLKCQIVRIMHSSNIVPKEYLKVSGDEKWKDELEGKITEYNPEYENAKLTFEDAKNPEMESWAHEYAYIYPSGKVIDPTVETQVERLAGISTDEGYKIKEGEGEEANEVDVKYWKLKVIGDQMIYNKEEEGGAQAINHAVVLIQNERWPGTNTVYKNGEFCNIYIGFGVKNCGEGYYPTQLGKVDKDPEDTKEQMEPFPEKEPVIPEPDTDEEKKEGEEEEN
ncbi:MAG: hypothetical protein MJ252_06615 [archaeon]|nr:hypothetical protein [archaeon]